MNDPKHMNDSFDDFLRQQLHTPYLDDNGFTARVMAAMPAKKPLNPWLEKCIVALPVVLISLLVLAQLPWRELVHQTCAWFLLLDVSSMATLVAVLFVALVVAPVAWLLHND